VAAQRALAVLLFLASGFAGLVYQVLWMRELGRLFGNDAQAVATTLAAFFLGIAAGSHVVGRRIARARRPLLVYAALEAGLAATALLYFAIVDAYAALYAPLYARLGDSPAAFLAVKFALALAALLPPAFFMGGTLPAMSQHLVRGAAVLGRTASGLYAVNTLGAALGAWLAGFVLVRHLGVHGAYALAVSTSVGVAALAAAAGRAAPPPPRATAPAAPGPAAAAALGRASLGVAAFASGFATLALEVLWTRMFAQVLQNSVYTFALVLAVFLVALALGAWLARALMRRVADPVAGLAALLLAAGIGVAASPWAFAWQTGGLAYFGGASAWSGYVLRATLSTALVLLPPGVLVGSVFPFLLRSAQELGWAAGRAVGETAAVNTLGAVAGSLAAGFVLLETLGLWPSLRVLAVGYAAAALWVAARSARPRPWLAAASALALVALATRLDPAGVPRVRVEARESGERVVDLIEGSGGIVAVIDRGGFLHMKLDNHYGLGGTDDVEQEERQTLLPLALHPRPRSVFFLGLGSGITAGAALRDGVERVVVAEISREVVDAARRDFAPWLHGLFEDPRATVLAEDGRNVLQGTRERFDVIVSDLFMPWLAGAGSLYSLEAYRAGRERLAPGGLYAQWLALFQLSGEEFSTIARTMAEVFPQLTLWRGNFRGSRPIALLLGSVDAPALDPEVVRERLRAWIDPDPRAGSAPSADPAQILLFYQGDLSRAADALGAGPIETDARPRIEYRAAIAHREKRAGRASALIDAEMVALYERIFERLPPESDPFLAKVGPDRRGLPRAGLDLLRAGILERSGDAAGAAAARAAFAAAWRRAGFGPAAGAAREDPSSPGDENESSDQRKTGSEMRPGGTGPASAPGD
jgi:spermidine synthase